MKKIFLLCLLAFSCGAVFAHSDPEVPQPLVDSLQSLRIFAYANDSAYWKQEIPQPSYTSLLIEKFLSMRLLRNLMIILLSAVLVFIFVRMVLQNRLQLFSGSGTRLKKEEAALPAATDYEHFIDAAEQQGDFRSAVRYQFLATLDRLKNGSWIHWRVDGTNRDYLEQVKKQRWQPEFVQLTRLYEKVWYGGMPVAAGQYQHFRRRFNDFNNKLS
ncbi:MAG: DUF4129 domain-containing protein [Flavihumibacter sp.]